MINQAFVLTAGLGTRMRPLTATRPKPLVELAGKSLVDHALDRLAEAGVETAVVNVHYLADQVIAHLEGREQPRILISDERDALLDTGGGAVKARSLLAERPFFMVNTDAVWVEGASPTLTRLGHQFDERRMDCLLLLAGVVNALGYDGVGDFFMDENGYLERRGPERPVVPFVFAGVSVVHPRVFDKAPDGAFSMNRIWDRALEAGRCFGLRHDGLWMHVGSPEALAAAEAAVSGRVRP